MLSLLRRELSAHFKFGGKLGRGPDFQLVASISFVTCRTNAQMFGLPCRTGSYLDLGLYVFGGTKIGLQSLE